MKLYNTKALLAIIGIALLGGAVSSVSKIALQEIPPLSFTCFRFTLASFLILPFIKDKKRFFTKDFISLIPLSLFASMNIFLFIFGVKLTTATISQFLYTAAPLIAAMILYILFKEKLQYRKVSGLLLGFTGTCIIILLPLLQKGHAFSGNIEGNMLITAGVISYSLYQVLSKRAHTKYPLFTLVAHFIIFTTLLSLPFSLFEILQNSTFVSRLSTTSLVSILYMSVCATIGTYLLNQYAIKHGGAVFASLTLYLQPIFAFFFAALLLGEKLTSGLIIGSILVFIGIFITTNSNSTT